MRTLVLAGKMGPAFDTSSVEMPHPIIGVDIVRPDMSDDIVFRDYSHTYAMRDHGSDVVSSIEGKGYTLDTLLSYLEQS